MASVISSSFLQEGPNILDRLKDDGLEEIYAHKGQIGWRNLGLFHQPDHLSALIQLGHSEPLRMGDLSEQYGGIGSRAS